MDKAAENDRLEVVKWLHVNRTEGCTPQALELACQNGHIDIVRWLLLNRTEKPTDRCLIRAAGISSLELVQLLEEYRGGGGGDNNVYDHIHPDVITWAANYGNINVIKYFYSRGVLKHTTPGLLGKAMSCRNLEIIQFLVEIRSEQITPECINYAAGHGLLDTIKYYHQKDKEIHHNGFTATAMDRAASGGHLEMVKWLHFNRSEGCTKQALDNAVSIRGGKGLDVARFLQANRTEGCSKSAYVYTIESGSLESLHFLHEYYPNIQASAHAIEGAVLLGHTEIIHFILHHRNEMYSTRSLTIANTRNRLEIVHLFNQFPNRKEN
ncbi:hypothetical protein DFA_06446 [Cavenderia fasciculata]|uniref:Ankyrin repeat-containing protein n=1 Tax=Cavenderia fasciculata TaxID=261658 RepID=F4PJ10_CACFS|nr:uncharacterized protein DFA_06446 [Cavenderia fasciculata]EGG24296.1 hypothetical protein DFA_06446 [Cavenderia fasciculata]|eukprot:XP_004362147.1 hypothetical protein DFA_06446 [Cavenderia fasciculata]